jgi:hypothetical protein
MAKLHPSELAVVQVALSDLATIKLNYSDPALTKVLCLDLRRTKPPLSPKMAHSY